MLEKLDPEILNINPLIAVVDDFLSPADCTALTQLAHSVSNFRILIQVSESPNPTEGSLNPSKFDTLQASTQSSTTHPRSPMHRMD